MADRIARVPQLLERSLVDADVGGRGIRLALATAEGPETIDADHVIAATGYRPSLDRLTFLAPGLRAAVRAHANTPILTSWFESSVDGLYFVGPVAANSFGPLMRFAFGANYAARRLSRHLAEGFVGREQCQPRTMPNRGAPAGQDHRGAMPVHDQPGA